MIDPVGIQELNARRARPIRRWGAMLGGGTLAVYGVTRRSPAGLALAGAGGVLAYLGATADRAPREFAADTSILLNCSAGDAYRFWHNLENLPRFMSHIASVHLTGERRARWVAHAPFGRQIEWETEIIDEREPDFFAWRSLPGAEIFVDAALEFRRAPANRGTLLSVQLRYRPPSALAESFMKFLGRDPGFMMRQDLRRFKALIETGEIPTIEGQTHGPRDLLTGMVRMVDPERPPRREGGLGKTLSALRRMA